MLLPLPKLPVQATPQSNGVVEWKLPHIDWNPWTCCSAYQSSGPFNSMEPETRSTQLSKNLYQEMSERKMNDPALRRVSHVTVATRFCMVSHMTRGGTMSDLCMVSHVTMSALHKVSHMTTL